MRREASGPVSWLAVLVGIAAVAGLVGLGRSEVSSGGSSEPISPPTEGAVVIALSSHGGFELFGIEWRRPRFSATVGFAVSGDECAAALGGAEDWPLPGDACAAPVAVTGRIAGMGRSASGDTLVSVSFPIDEACHAELKTGMPWPPELAVCA